MQEDDEFGELYTDVLTSFTSSPSLSIQKGVSIENDRKENTSFDQFNSGGSSSRQELNRVGLDEPARVLEIDSSGKLRDDRVLGFEDPNLVDESLINVSEGEDGDHVVIGDTVIAGLPIPGVADGGVLGDDNSDWSDSDSDDGLQILFDDFDAGQIGDGVEVDENGNVIDTVDEAAERRMMEGQEWYEDTGILYGGFDMRDEDGERKELGYGAVKGKEVVQPPNIGVGYSNQSHSQFKVSDIVRAGNVCS